MLDDIVQVRLVRGRTVEHNEVTPSGALAHSLREIFHLDGEPAWNSSSVAFAVKGDSEGIHRLGIDFVRGRNRMKTVHYGALGLRNPETEVQAMQIWHVFLDRHE